MKVVAFFIQFALSDLIGWNRLGNNVHYRKMHRHRQACKQIIGVGTSQDAAHGNYLRVRQRFHRLKRKCTF